MGKRKVTDEQIVEIKELRNNGMIYREIANMFGVSYAAVYGYINPERCRQYDKKNRENHKEERRQYHETHREERRQYREAHREERRQYDRQYHKDHGKDRRQYCKDHKEERRQASRRYYESHIPETTAKRAARRALKASALIVATADQRIEIKEIYRRAKEEPNEICYLCGKIIPLGDRHVDHVTPITKRGKHSPSNLAITHAGCNLCKGTKLLTKIRGKIDCDPDNLESISKGFIKLLSEGEKI